MPEHTTSGQLGLSPLRPAGDEAAGAASGKGLYVRCGRLRNLWRNGRRDAAEGFRAPGVRPRLSADIGR